MYEHDDAFWRLVDKGTPEDHAALWALLENLGGKCADNLRQYSKGTLKRAIRCCRMAQSDARRAGDSQVEGDFDNAVTIIRRELRRRGGVA